MCYHARDFDLSHLTDERTMSAEHTMTGATAVSQAWRRWRTTGTVILLFGLSAAGVVYWTGTPPDDYSADPSTARAYKTDQRNVEINFGRMGLLAADFTEEMQHPGVQAGIILVVAAGLSSGCFYFSRLMAQTPPSDDTPAKPE